LLACREYKTADTSLLRDIVWTR